MVYSRIVLIIGLVLILLGALEMVRPFGPAALRSNPPLVIVVGLLLAGRHMAYETARRRRMLLEEVPKKPLGLE